MDQLPADKQQLLQIGVIPAMLIIAAAVGLAIWRWRREDRKRRELEQRELAVMYEESTMTAGGTVCVLMLLATVVVALLIFTQAKSAIHEIEAAVVLLAGSSLFGLGIVLGRTRSYRIYRSEHREPY